MSEFAEGPQITKWSTIGVRNSRRSNVTSDWSSSSLIGSRMQVSLCSTQVPFAKQTAVVSPASFFSQGPLASSPWFPAPYSSSLQRNESRGKEMGYTTFLKLNCIELSVMSETQPTLRYPQCYSCNKAWIVFHFTSELPRCTVGVRDRKLKGDLSALTYKKQHNIQ